MADNYKQAIKDLVTAENRFVKLTLKGKLRGKFNPWRRIVVRPVLLKSGRYLQFSYFDDKQDITKNYQGAEALAKLDEALAWPFSGISLKATDTELNVQITRKGKAIIHHHQPGRQQKVALAHDHSKALPLPPDQPHPFLQSVGIMTKAGQIKASMRGKFAQINEFLKLLEHTGELDNFDAFPLNILDCGCGHAYLTLGAFYYLNDIRGIPAKIVGIDTNQKLVEKCAAIAAELSCSEVCFQRSSIIDFVPDAKPDIIFALHACDTATDEALAQGILWDTRLIMSVPCCHHELNRQLGATDLFRPVLRHGILKQRLADILTDSFRALILRIMGYKTDVVEFISTEHTARNLMIRAVKTMAPGEQQFIQEYNDLKAYWRVSPYLEKLLGESLTRFL